MLIERIATNKDLTAINEIYNNAVLQTTATFETEPRSLEQCQKWFDAHTEKYPVMVAEDNGEVVGWASLSRFSPRKAYDITAEASVYIRKNIRHRGIGTALLGAVLKVGECGGLHTVLARISGDNEASVRLFRHAGFVSVGILREVGIKFGKMLDVNLMQLVFGKMDIQK